MKRAHFTPLFVALVILALVSACGPTVQPTTAIQPTTAVQPTAKVEPTPVPPTAAQGRKVVTFIWTQEFDTLNPLYTNMWFASTTFQLWDCYAWNYDDVNAPVPVLVTEMPSLDNKGISADGTVITLTLRPDLVWSDGTPLTSADFRFTYDMTMSPKNAVASTSPYEMLTALETPDPQTVVMRFAEPFAPWQGTFWHGIIPEHILKPVFDQEGTIDNADWNRNPTVGCGPFVFDSWESGSFARFVASDNYWLGRPKLDEIFFRFVPDDASQLAALKAGDGDLGTFMAYSDFPALEEAGIKIVMVNSGYDEGIYFYQGEKGHVALKDVNVRKAIALATNRQKLCDDLLLGRTKPAATYWDNSPWVDPTLQPYPFDPEQAKALLDAAGWVDSNGDGVRDKDGVELVLKYGTTTREIRKDTQAVFQQQLADVGIKVDLLNYESDTYFGSYADGGPCATGELDMFQYSTSANYPDPYTSEWMCDQIPTDANPEGINWQSVCDPQLEALWKQQATQVDFKARQQTLWQISKYIFDQVYFLGVWQDPDSWAVGAKLQNVKVSGATPFFNIMEWDKAP